MSGSWHASMQGVPWNEDKMNEAVRCLRHRATVSIAVGADQTEDLFALDKQVFFRRPDLILHVWNRDEKASYTKEFLETLAQLKHAAALKLDLRQSQDLSTLGAMEQMQFLNVSSPKKAVNLEFIESYKRLTYLELHGKFTDLTPISECIHLDTLVLNCKVDRLDVAAELPLLKYLGIDSCELNAPLAALGDSNVSMLRLSAVRKLSDIGELALLHNLEFLHLALPKVEYLCNFSKLDRLRQLELDYMKSLRNIDQLWTARNLEAITLKEINTSIKAEAFDPLAEMEHLRQVDFRFIDMNKGRIAAMRERLEHAGKGHLLIDHIPEEQRIRSMVIEHLSPILM
ncbi:hypothetical protein MKY59_23095 [Paenibacillus sp. FSL W8-0426]|uniref:hypothetical protein n=1 Tax=Paenibacillus sp. FSL W8-0426 TaxID=2921714 RepID=UPI0030DD679C